MRQILGLKPTRNLLEGRLVLRAIGSVGQDVSAPQGPRVVSTRSQKRPVGALFSFGGDPVSGGYQSSGRRRDPRHGIWDTGLEGLFMEHLKSTLLIICQRGGVVHIAGVKPQAMSA